MIDVCIRRGEFGHRHRREVRVKREAEMGVIRLQISISEDACNQLEEARKESSHGGFREHRSANTKLDFRLPASRTARKYISIVLSSSVGGAPVRQL